MALAELLQAIERDAAAQIEAVLAAAEAEVRQIEADGQRDQARLRTDVARTVREEHQRDADAEIAIARRNARVEVLVARAAMLERVRTALQAQLPELARPLGTVMVTAALSCVGSARGVLRCPTEWLDHARAVAPPSLELEAAPPGATGVMIELATGTHVVATLETLLEREWPRLATEAQALADRGAA